MQQSGDDDSVGIWCTADDGVMYPSGALLNMSSTDNVGVFEGHLSTYIHSFWNVVTVMGM